MDNRRVALVTGGTRGIGRAIASRLMAADMDVAVNYRQDEVSAQEAVAALSEAGPGRVRAHRADVATRSGAERLVAAVHSDFGPVSVLVHNAGVSGSGRLLADAETEELQQLLSTHVIAAHTLARLVIPTMRNSPRGDLIFVSSFATMMMRAGSGPYTMAKAALESMAQTLDREEARHGIRVNVVAPGLTDTEMGRRGAMEKRGVTLDEIGTAQPFGRVCTPEDVAELIGFLVSPKAEFITGQRIYLHGGVYGW